MTFDPANQLITRRVSRAADNFPIDDDHWQALCTFSADQVVNPFVFDEGLGLLCQIVAFNLMSLLLQPIEFEANCGNTGSTSGPQMPVAQHMGLS